MTARSAKDHAYWLADKIPALGDYAKEAAIVLRRQADEVERLAAIEEAARNLIAQKGRHNTQQAYERLVEAIEKAGAYAETRAAIEVGRAFYERMSRTPPAA